MNRVKSEVEQTFRIEISGLVQGVGFRPFVYRLAREHKVSGCVENRNDGLVIQFNQSAAGAERFRQAILDNAPPASDIDSAILHLEKHMEFDAFSIKKSQDLSDRVTEISPDISVCSACLDEMKSQAHRISYPFINCTHCGPRFSIVTDLPYDRPNTTMDTFVMCHRCKAEYDQVSDRRFHAQPIACKHCGPTYTLHSDGSRVEGLDLILDLVKEGLPLGAVYALKGMGGYHLMCDAFSETGVRKLREIKKRDGKPFAVMFRSAEAASSFVKLDPAEEQLLLSWRRPIVLLRKKGPITWGIADALDTLGVMLPYMPFHTLLFEMLDTPAIVLTSGNLADEPILLSNPSALDQFAEVCDGIITHNREIYNRNDDSVSVVFRGQPGIIRRSRGYAPSPIRLSFDAEGIFAAGAELTAAFCMGKGKRAFMSQHIGDLRNMETLRFYEEAFDRFGRMFRFTPELIVHDLHPDYLSSGFTRELSERLGGVPMIPVQHHHAHVASVMLDHNLEGEVIGFSMDGMGLGADGNIWGAEIMIASYKDYKRVSHFEYMPLPGGDQANREPWRMAVSYLYHAFGEGFSELALPLFKKVDESKLSMITQMIEKSVNTPLISSAGRLFDAVSAILGINYSASYQAEAPMCLEALADPSEKGLYPVEVEDGLIKWAPMIRDMVQAFVAGSSAGTISSKFHNTLVLLLVQQALEIRGDYDLKRVVLSGGSFQNRILTEGLFLQLEKEGFQVYYPRHVPVNDQGIALGQLAIGAALRS